MGKTNWVILVLGLGACLALSLMMKQALTIKDETRRDPIIKGIVDVFGNRLERRPEFRVEPREGKKFGVLTIQPRLTHASRHLADTLGAFAWRNAAPGQFDELQVIALGLDAPDQKFIVDRPPMMGRFGAPRGRANAPRQAGAKPLSGARLQPGLGSPPPLGSPAAGRPGQPPARPQLPQPAAPATGAAPPATGAASPAPGQAK